MGRELPVWLDYTLTNGVLPNYRAAFPLENPTVYADDAPASSIVRYYFFLDRPDFPQASPLIPTSDSIATLRFAAQTQMIQHPGEDPFGNPVHYTFKLRVGFASFV